MRIGYKVIEMINSSRDLSSAAAVGSAFVLLTFGILKELFPEMDKLTLQTMLKQAVERLVSSECHYYHLFVSSKTERLNFLAAGTARC